MSAQAGEVEKRAGADGAEGGGPSERSMCTTTAIHLQRVAEMVEDNGSDEDDEQQRAKSRPGSITPMGRWHELHAYMHMHACMHACIHGVPA